ncbi:MAG: hypothetical protein DMF71_06505 [Acidobacteria bacterium]|nr:MAG: hypothetical protein DMF71_06505 [Acidobacteriota bacterium]
MPRDVKDRHRRIADPTIMDSTQTNLATIEREVEARSTALKKELGLRDLVLIQVVFVVGTVWVGFAAKLGSSQMAFWLIAIACDLPESPGAARRRPVSMGQGRFR